MRPILKFSGQRAHSHRNCISLYLDGPSLDGPSSLVCHIQWMRKMSASKCQAKSTGRACSNTFRSIDRYFHFHSHFECNAEAAVRLGDKKKQSSCKSCEAKDKGDCTRRDKTDR